MNKETARSQMSAKLLPLADAWEEKCIAAGLKAMYTCVARTPTMQLALVLQGRTIQESIDFLKQKIPFAVPEIKELAQSLILALGDTPLKAYDFCLMYRNSCGLPAISRGDFSGKVTWTLNSRHFPGEDGKADAFDFAFNIEGREWDIKLDQNKTGTPDFDEAGKIAQAVGLRWGGEFGDKPHIEVRKG